MKAVSVLVIGLVVLAAVSGATTTSATTSVFERLAQTWTFKTTTAGDALATTTYTLPLRRSMHFTDQAIGVLKKRNEQDVEEQMPIQVTITAGKDNMTADVTVSVLDASGAEASSDAEEEADVYVAGLRLKIAAIELDAGLGLVATGNVVAARGITQLVKALAVTEGTAVGSALATAAKAGTADSAVVGTFALELPAATAVVLTLHVGTGDAAVPVVFSAVGDAAPTVQGPWWQRFGPSAAMFGVMMVMQIFSAFIGRKQETKAIAQAAYNQAQGAKK